jgi:hypothetical protein
MIDVNKEAEEYAKDLIESKSAQPHESTWVSSIFISGHNSKSTQAKVLQAQIDENNSILELIKLRSECLNERLTFVIKNRINNLEQQLKELENEIQS